MNNNSAVKSTDYKQFIIVVILTLITSILPDIILREWFHRVPTILPSVKVIILFLAFLLFQYLKNSKISKYILVLTVIVIVELLTKFIASSSLWQVTFDKNSFVGNFGGSILLKVIGIIPVVAVLIALFKSPKEVFISKGDFSVKVEEIKWLSIKKDKISWRKLTIISATLISIGTALLTIGTVTGTSANLNTNNLIKYFPFAVVFAILNSLCEGIVYRNAVLGSLKNVLPKNELIFIAAMFFGIAHYYGAPSGMVGVAMSGVLGWFLTRSMYETKGFVSSWIIHCMQDIVIFSTILLLGNFH